MPEADRCGIRLDDFPRPEVVLVALALVFIIYGLIVDLRFVGFICPLGWLPIPACLQLMAYVPPSNSRSSQRLLQLASS